MAKSAIEYMLNNKINIPIGYFIRNLVNNIFIYITLTVNISMILRKFVYI